MPKNVEEYRTIPAQVPGLTNVTAIAAGPDFAMALRDDGTVWTWGDNQFGTLGDGTTDNSNVPVQVKGLSGIVAISPGYSLDENGVIWAWGPDTEGQLGDGVEGPVSIAPRQKRCRSAKPSLAHRSGHHGWCPPIRKSTKTFREGK